MTDFELVDQLRQRLVSIDGPGEECICGKSSLEYLAVIEEGIIEQNPNLSPEEVAGALLHDLAAAFTYGAIKMQDEAMAQDAIMGLLRDMLFPDGPNS